MTFGLGKRSVRHYKQVLKDDDDPALTPNIEQCKLQSKDLFFKSLNKKLSVTLMQSQSM